MGQPDTSCFILDTLRILSAMWCDPTISDSLHPYVNLVLKIFKFNTHWLDSISKYSGTRISGHSLLLCNVAEDQESNTTATISGSWVTERIVSLANHFLEEQMALSNDNRYTYLKCAFINQTYTQRRMNHVINCVGVEECE